MVVCSACGSTDEDSFSKRQLKKGLQARCKSCIEESQKEEREKFDDVSDKSDESDSDNGADHEGGTAGGGVSVEDLKRQILGRSIKTRSPSEDEEDENKTVTCKQDLRNELQCAICHELLLEPTSLICGHSYCRACLDWWIAKTPKCPTCRRPVSDDYDDYDDPSRQKSFGVNTALRSCIEFLFPTELDARRAQARKALSGENDGQHNRGYQVEQALRNETFRAIYRDVKARNSIILDASDRQMRLALSIESLEWKTNEDENEDDDENQTLRISLCLLQMEEDEVEEAGGAPLLLKDEGDEHLICNSSRFKTTHIEGYNKRDGDDSDELMDRKSLSNSLVSFNISYGSYIFKHSESGAELELRVREGIEPMDDAGDEDDMEAEHTQEDDDFVVDEDVCQICKDGGDLIICDGGEDHGGCSRSFHLSCINRTVIPEGDWICQECSKDIPGLGNVGVEGHEFGAEDDEENNSVSEGQFSPLAPTGKTNKEDESSASEMDEEAQFSPGPEVIDDDDEDEAPQIIQRKRRKIQVFDDDDDDE